jgi:hypothetical protein
MRDEFWIVWSPTGTRSPQYRHTSESDAINEAVRLANEKSGAEFFVCKASHRAVSRHVDLTVLATGDDYIPF